MATKCESSAFLELNDELVVEHKSDHLSPIILLSTHLSSSDSPRLLVLQMENICSIPHCKHFPRMSIADPGHDPGSNVL